MEPTAFFDFPSRGKANFRRFLVFPRGGKLLFADFWFSLMRESRFLVISDFPPWGKTDFRWILIFPREGKPFFGDFWFSPVEESWFSLIFVRRTLTKRDFSYFPLIVGVRSLVLCVFHQSYPYESFFFLFFVDCTPVSELFFLKIDDYTPYLSRFSWKWQTVSLLKNEFWLSLYLSVLTFLFL